MKVTFVVAGLLSLGLITSSPASELKEELGGTVENGGNSAYCDPWQLFGRGQHVYLPPNNGPAVYMLDYAHAIAEGAELADFDWMPRGGWPAERDRLERTLDGASPVLAEDFREFAVSTEQIHPSAAVPEARRRWIPLFGARHRGAHPGLRTTELPGPSLRNPELAPRRSGNRVSWLQPRRNTARA